MSEASGEGLSTRAAILAEARRCFAEAGYDGTSLNDIAAGVGIRRPSLLHHFPSKDVLYGEVFEQLLSDWYDRLAAAVQSPGEGLDKVDLVIGAGFDLFADNPDYVRLVRREAMDGGQRLAIDLAGVLRPMTDLAVAFLEREMAAGRLRSHDARHLVITGYGVLLTWFSDAPLLAGLVDSDPLDAATLAGRRVHVLEFFRSALAPSSGTA